MVGGRLDKLGFSRLRSDDVASLVESAKLKNIPVSTDVYVGA